MGRRGRCAVRVGFGRTDPPAGLAGALFAGDVLLWTQAIAEVGAGLSTVLVNVQVVLALMIDGEPVTRRYVAALPFLLAGQVVGWLLMAMSSPRLPSHVGAILLLLTPVGAVILGAVVLGERPSLVQLGGCALILASAYLGTSGRTPRSGGVSARRFVRPLR